MKGILLCQVAGRQTYYGVTMNRAFLAWGPENTSGETAGRKLTRTGLITLERPKKSNLQGTTERRPATLISGNRGWHCSLRGADGGENRTKGG